MLKKVELTNFRRHEHLVVDFTNGLNVLRAANEGGKSTLLEAVGYALFGTSALRDTFAETVTWGKPEKDLKVRLHIDEVVFTRSKGGAEVVKDGKVFVTGQKEVSTFASKLLGCDANTATKLMIATQVGLRDVFAGGPKATAQLIEDLGDFDLFDRLLAAAEAKLALGSSAGIESRLETLRKQVDEFVVPAAPEEGLFHELLKGVEQTVALQQSVLSTLAEKKVEVEAQHKVEAERQRTHQQLERDIDRLAGEVRATQKQIDDNVIYAESLTDTAALEATIVAAKGWEAANRAYRAFKSLPAVDFTEGNRASLVARIKQGQAELEGFKAEITTERTAIRVAEAGLVAAKECTYCGQDVSELPAAKAKNAALTAEIAERKARIALVELGMAIVKDILDDMAKLSDDEDRMLKAARALIPYVSIDESVFPAKVTWVRDVPTADGPDVAALERALKETKAQNDAIIKARAKVETLGQMLQDQTKKLGAACDARDAMGVVDPAALQALATQLNDLAGQIRDTERAMMDLESQRKEAERDFAERQRRYADAVSFLGQMQKQVAGAEAELKTLAFNNQLIKKVRAARPVIGNKLWSMVLATVSTIFSALRGEKSVVVKGTDGFLVNGRSVDSLSGSTLDLLGLAIRVALVKTFIPNCPLLVLDEPSSACDADRTAAMFGYIAASGFRQVVMVTHNDTADALATNLITL